jgi:FkbM family methyltransferase
VAVIALRVDSLWYDAIVRWLTHRAPRVVARALVRAHRLLVRDRLTPIDADTFRIAVSPQDNIGHHLFYYGTYEPEQVALWKQLLASGRDIVVLDVGANIGYYSLIAATHPNVKRVIGFEPNELVLPALRYNVGLNPGAAAKLSIAEVAVGDANGVVKFYRNRESHNFGLGSMRAQGRDPVTVEVPLVRLDSFLPSQGLDHVDLIKIDVEGAEAAVITGLREWWAQHRRPTIAVEVHPGLLPDFGSSVRALFGTLASAGYRLERLNGDGRLEPATDTFKAISWVLARPSA